MKAFFTHQFDVTWDSAEAAKKHGYDLIDQFEESMDLTALVNFGENSKLL